LRQLCLLLVLLTATRAAAQEPRLPPPHYPNATIESLEPLLKVDPPPVDALILRARLLSTAGRFGDSARAWLDVAAREPHVTAFARAEAVRAAIDAGDLQAALAGIDGLTPPVTAEILVRAAAVARATGSLYRASELYKQARANAGRSVVADQAALGLAGTQEQAGHPREALDTFRELQLTFRQLTAYDAADQGARRLAKQLGDAELLSEADYDVIADRLTSIAAFRRAVDVLTEWRTRFPDSARAGEIDNAIIQNLYSLRANDEARTYAEGVIKKREGQDSAAAFRTLFSLDVREGKTAEVERRGFALLRGEVKGSTLAQRQGAGRQLAEYLVSVGRFTRALDAYDRLYLITKSRVERIDLQWRMAVASLRAGRKTKAIAQLRQLRAMKLDSETDRATRFLLGYALSSGSASPETRSIWKGLIERYPFSYYGARAAAKLQLPLPEPALTFPTLTLRDAVLASNDYQTAALLSQAGLLQEAAYYARRVSAAFRRDDAAALLAARASGAAGDPSATSTLMTTFFGEYLERPATNLPPDFWTLAYPQAYWNEVAAAAGRHHVDPLLMLALARQESHFDRAAKSPVGAVGLFQIMPSRAVELDPAFDITKAEELLVQPAVAAELAAKHLEQNLESFKGAIAPAVASYNADKERVLVWWDSAKEVPEELFVDSIPYRETRGYVRQVLANYAMYQRVAVLSASPQK